MGGDGDRSGVILAIVLLLTLILPHLSAWWASDNNISEPISSVTESGATSPGSAVSELTAKETKIEAEIRPESLDAEKKPSPGTQDPQVKKSRVTDESTVKPDAADDNSGWRCACEGGFLPPGLLRSSMGGAEAVFRMSTGQCYHKS